MNTSPPGPGGIIYCIIPYFVMNYIVIPLSGASLNSFSLAVFLNGVIVHALLGLPTDLMIKKFTYKPDTLRRPETV